MANLIRAKAEIPIYGGTITLLVSSDREVLEAEHTRYDIAPIGDALAQASQRGNKFFMSFYRKALTRGVVAHECFHSTHQILSYRGDVFHTNHDEPYAYLNEWLTTWVYRRLSRYRVEVPI